MKDLQSNIIVEMEKVQMNHRGWLYESVYSTFYNQTRFKIGLEIERIGSAMLEYVEGSNLGDINNVW